MQRQSKKPWTRRKTGMKRSCGKIYQKWRQKALVYSTPEMGSMSYINTKCSGMYATGGAKVVALISIATATSTQSLRGGAMARVLS
jgi:hypothetical protein